jgi:hypothetical protein
LLQDTEEVFLRAAGFGKNEGLLLKRSGTLLLPCLSRGSEAAPQCG